jgi:hypothetical protein
LVFQPSANFYLQQSLSIDLELHDHLQEAERLVAYEWHLTERTGVPGVLISPVETVCRLRKQISQGVNGK